MPVVILLADGVRHDSLRSAIDSGAVPALARLRDEGALHRVTTCFPSVTGPAYTPFLMGRFPGDVGLPGLRWFDRTRAICDFPDYARSYVGYQMGRADDDLDPSAPTIFELCGRGLSALSIIGRGLSTSERVGRLTPRSAARAAWTHFRGNVAGWLDIDREVAASVTRRIREDRPDFVFAALMGIDKTSHAMGHEAALVASALQIVDQTAAQIREDAERDGRWDDLHLWVTSDHGHSPVRAHEDLVGFIAGHGVRTIAHPWVYAIGARIAVMVSGNAMAHVYLDIGTRTRAFWPELGTRWANLADSLLARPSVDLAILPRANGALVRSADRGEAEVASRGGRMRGARVSYRRLTGDPLGIGQDLDGVSVDEAYEATIDTDYPDSVVQIAAIAMAPRSGDIILSASRDWDFRSRYEPIPHVSSHGALHREHMLVPLLVNRHYRGTPRRTTDVMPSALAALRKRVPEGLDGESFL